MTWARDVGTRTGLFVVPRVLDVTANSLTQEFLTGFVQLRTSDLIRTAPDYTAQRLARILVAIHDAPAAAQGRDELPRHGDFTCENVLYNAPADSFAIVDWSDPRWLAQADSLLGQHLDLATFVMSVFASNPFGNGIPDAWRIAESFLRSYGQYRPGTSTLQELRASFPGILRRFYGYKWDPLTRARLWTYRWSYRRAERFVQKGNF